MLHQEYCKKHSQRVRYDIGHDEETLKLGQIDKIGLAVNSPSGETTVSNIDIKTGKNEVTYLNSRWKEKNL